MADTRGIAKASIYQKAAAACSDIRDLYRWEATRCSGEWDAGPYLIHLCGYKRGHKGHCRCRHCGKTKEL